MRVEIGRFERFARGKKLSRCCGLSLCNRFSGKRQTDAGLSRQQSSGIRFHGVANQTLAIPSSLQATS